MCLLWVFWGLIKLMGYRKANQLFIVGDLLCLWSFWLLYIWAEKAGSVNNLWPNKIYSQFSLVLLNQSKNAIFIIIIENNYVINYNMNLFIITAQQFSNVCLLLTLCHVILMKYWLYYNSLYLNTVNNGPENQSLESSMLSNWDSKV